jgi:hypothetical protein
MSCAPTAPSRHVPAGLIVAALVGFALIRAPFLSLPLERDEGEYAYIAQRMLAGDVPYRDAFDQKPPGVFVAYALAFTLLAESIEGIHLFLWLWTAAAGATLFALVRALAGGVAGGFALLAFALASADPQLQGHAANTENWMLLPLVLSAAACVRGWRRGNRLSWLACGGFAALACWFKQVAVTDACLLAAGVLGDGILGRPAPAARTALARGALFALGAALASAPALLYLAATGALAPFLDAVFLHNLGYARASSWAEGLANLRVALARQGPSFAAVWALALAGWLLPGRVAGPVRHALAAWWLASFAGAAIGLHFRPHYFLQTVPALCALAGIGAAGLAERLGARRARPPGWSVAAIAALVAVLPFAAHRDLLLAGSPAAISRQFYGLNPFPESLVIAQHVARNSGPEDRVFVVGSEPQILFYAGRRSATRYIFFYPLTGDYPDARARQQAVIEEVRAARPLYVVWVDVLTSLLRTERTEPLVFDATAALLERDYRVELVARLDASGRTYAFDRGDAARRFLREARESRHLGRPWIAVHRRTP